MDFSAGGLCKTLLMFAVVFYFAFISLFTQYPNCLPSDFFTPFHKNLTFSESISTNKSDSTPLSSSINSPTNISHLVFGLVGSEKAWYYRKAYIQSWWRPNITRGFLFLDRPPTRKLLPWSPASPPYRISDDLTKFLNKTDITPQRIVNGIWETYREDHENMRWLVMGDDDSIFFLDNIINVLQKYDHTKYYYIGGHSEFVLSNYLFSFSQGFGGAGFILSYPLAKALVEDMENCLKRYSHLIAADQATMSCIADFGVNLTPLDGIHQLDFRGDISGFLSSHPKFPLMSLHHFDMVAPIFPSMNRFQSTGHLMKAANADQSRMLQQTICYHRENNWSFSIAWGYSAHIYENIIPRSVLQYPIETFKTWLKSPGPPHYMFNTRLPSRNPCEAPHIFFFENVQQTKESNETVTSYRRGRRRGLPPCSFSGGHSADHIYKITVVSPMAKRVQIDRRSECCDVVRVDRNRAKVKFRECVTNEIIA